ncbi:cytochrome P450 [Streptomyces sp. SID12501]|uniref:Cytochrome P450 n=1 Tax=Streptomyces sp. SID12501 TaxID=2706042 RepID=A0A6B3BZI1_9ACTN|nr:cytochrome P450 [Streptomyces sp. SID12501]NEC89684.1 cytochrome P450 [Streptomyces sp. SID12501]
MSDMLSQKRRDGVDPAVELGQLRSQPPAPQDLWPGCRAWLVTRYDDVRAVLSDHTRFSNDVLIGGPMEPTAGYTMRYDPPEHSRLRRILTPEFTMRRIARLRPRIEAIVAEHLDRMAANGPTADLVEAFAMSVPSPVICELLGVPHEDQETFQRHSKRMTDYTSTPDELAQSFAEMYAYMADLVDLHRREPADDLLSGLIREGSLGNDEIVSPAATSCPYGRRTCGAGDGGCRTVRGARRRSHGRTGCGPWGTYGGGDHGARDDRTGADPGACSTRPLVAGREETCGGPHA